MSHLLIETLEINDRIFTYWFENIENEWLTNIAASKGRNVGEQFVYLHNVRSIWLKAGQPELLVRLEKVEKGQDPGKDFLYQLLVHSSSSYFQLIENGLA